MSVIPCRECHLTDQHSATCSHARYDRRLRVLPEDAVAADHSPPQPYCPGPNIACLHGSSGIPDLCSFSDGPCYYGTVTVEEWEAAHGMTAYDWIREFRGLVGPTTEETP